MAPQLLELMASDRQSQAGHMLLNLSSDPQTLITEVSGTTVYHFITFQLKHLLLLVLFSLDFGMDVFQLPFLFHTLYILLCCRWWKHLVIASGRALFLSSCLESSPPQVPPSWPMMTSVPLTHKSQNSPSWLSGTMVSGVQGCPHSTMQK